MNERFAAGREFILRQGRLLEQRLFATCFENAPGNRAIDVLKGYANDDGGFGHGLEPDKRCPASLPIDVEVALQTMAAARTVDPPLVRGACEYLAKVAADMDCGAAVPLAFPVIEAYPRAAHWTEWTYQPGLNPSAGIVGLLYRLRVNHPWIPAAAKYCWEQLDKADLPTDAHALNEVLVFLEHTPESERASSVAARVRESLLDASWFRLDPDDTSYGLSPLSVAPFADSLWRSLFADDVIQAHLDRLERDQQADGGWPIAWEPPGPASLLEWRGIVTLQSMRTLVSFGRLDPEC
ncbi:hypothetical protein [Planotetraspora kaengkrachanensis]|uniref:Uncharacterized protein n=1 Tax=Planotetraspora kaengkrachanensis TaxID=575193 RepID=A0A8J3VAB7_9ACTN|nr:hypothetical protein [Planotetraspora kaengkrachanensis]GIG82694.1 hypothetical protein Pka01_58210 [Planotetraspora kaengkrachanensis]